MATKNYYYVLTCTSSGPRFVTKTVGKWAEWNINEKPLEMPRWLAYDVATGLSWNGFVAFVVCSRYELASHPYNYDEYKLVWTKKGGNDDRDND